MTVSTLTPISPTEVHAMLARHMLADGFDMVLDLDKSHGAWVRLARRAGISTCSRSSPRSRSATTTRR